MLAVFLTFALAQGTLEPPVHRIWSRLTSYDTAVHGVWDDSIHFTSRTRAGVLDLRSGEPRWESARQIVRAGASNGKTIFTLEEHGNSWEVFGFNVSDGREHKLFAGKNMVPTMAADSANLYLLSESNTLLDLDPLAGSEKWHTQLAAKASEGLRGGRLSLGSGCLYASVGDGGEFCVDPGTGKVRWTFKGQYAGLYEPIFLPGGVLSQLDGTFRDSMTGVKKWQVNGDLGSQGFSNGVLVANVGHRIVGIDVVTGRQLWELQMPAGPHSFRVGGGNPSAHTNGDEVWLRVSKQTETADQDRNPFLLQDVTIKGESKWTMPIPYTGDPVYADAGRLVCQDRDRILCYGSGGLTPWPLKHSDRKKAVEASVADFEKLDEAEQEHLLEARDFAFRPLVARLAKFSLAEDAAERSTSNEDLRFYGLVDDAAQLLDKMFRPEDTDAAVTAWKTLPSSSRATSILEQLMMTHGDQNQYIPLLIKKLRSGAKDRSSESAIEAVARSTRPDAVEFLIEALANPKADPAVRRAAYLHLAGTGGDAGVSAVRAWQKHAVKLKPWYDRIDPQALRPRSIKAVKKDAQGRTWMLFESSVLGDSQDLFIAQKTKTGWSRPLWTGIHLGRVWKKDEIKSYRGVPIKTLVESKWISIFPNDASIRKDTDGDGLTDLVEARLGTNPLKKDTDADGVPDLVDPCPNGAPRKMGDAEKIIAASVEARLFEEPYTTPAEIKVDGIKPFEMYGYPQILMWSAGENSPLGLVYGGGMNSISFYSPDAEQGRSGYFIKFSPDHRTARTMISRYSGGLNGDGQEVTLKKIGDEWFVVDMVLRVIS